MNELNILLWARAIERLLVVLCAGISMVLGWNLFRAHIQRDQVAEFTSQKVSIRLQRVGPGIFFSLFGSLILALSLVQPVSITGPPAPGPEPSASPRTTVTPKGASLTPGSAVSYWTVDREKDWEYDLKALNTISQMGIDSTRRAPLEVQAREKAKAWLSLQRDVMLQERFGDFFQRYQLLRAQAPITPSVLEDLSEREKQQYWAISRVANDTFVSR
jgi:hypothetical protein